MPSTVLESNSPSSSPELKNPAPIAVAPAPVATGLSLKNPAPLLICSLVVLSKPLPSALATPGGLPVTFNDSL